jgi:hypothetical protein
LQKVRIRFDEKLAWILVGKNKFSQEITMMLWDAVGEVKGLRVVIEGCENEEQRRWFAKSVKGFDVDVET